MALLCLSKGVVSRVRWGWAAPGAPTGELQPWVKSGEGGASLCWAVKWEQSVIINRALPGNFPPAVSRDFEKLLPWILCRSSNQSR